MPAFSLSLLFPTVLSLIVPLATLLAAIGTVWYYKRSVTQKGQELKQTQQADLFEQMVKLAALREEDLSHLREDVHRLEQRIISLTQEVDILSKQLEARDKENERLAAELHELRKGQIPQSSSHATS